MFLAQDFKKVRCEVGLPPKVWVVQGGAMHWQKMGGRRGGSASLHKGLENWWNKGLNMSLVNTVNTVNIVNEMLNQKNGETKALLLVPYPLSLPSLAGLCSSCPLLTASKQPRLWQVPQPLSTVLHSPATAAGDSKLGCWPHYPKRLDEDIFINQD